MTRGSHVDGASGGDPAVARLTSLRDRGAEGFDPVRFRLAERLLARSATLPGAAARLLRRRAEAQLEALDSSMPAATAAAAAAVAALADAAAVPGWLTEAHARGDTQTTYTSARRLLRAALRQRRRRAVVTRAEAYAPASPSDAAEGVDADEAHSVERALAMIQRAEAVLPETAGPYHPETVAHRALHALGVLAPELLAAHVTTLVDLDAVVAALAPPPRASAPKRARRSSR